MNVSVYDNILTLVHCLTLLMLKLYMVVDIRSESINNTVELIVMLVLLRVIILIFATVCLMMLIKQHDLTCFWAVVLVFSTV